MDVREKLVELIEQSGACFDCFPVAGYEKDEIEKIASHLMAHGVTVQEWISVKDRLPENDYGKHWQERKYYLVCLQNGMMRVARFGYEKNDWWIDSHDCVLHKDFYTEVTHWMETPQPPKGE